MIEIDDKDRRWLQSCWKHSNGKAWQPKNIEAPFLKRMEAAGLLEIKMMTWRCGFEAWDDMGVSWTPAGAAIGRGDPEDLADHVRRALVSDLCPPGTVRMLQDGFNPLLNAGDVAAAVVKRLEAGGISRPAIVGCFYVKDAG